MTEAERNNLRTLQDELLGKLRGTSVVWIKPLWPGGPSPLDLEHGVYPRWAGPMKAMLVSLEAIDKMLEKSRGQQEGKG